MSIDGASMQAWHQRPEWSSQGLTSRPVRLALSLFEKHIRAHGGKSPSRRIAPTWGSTEKGNVTDSCGHEDRPVAVDEPNFFIIVVGSGHHRLVVR